MALDLCTAKPTRPTSGSTINLIGRSYEGVTGKLPFGALRTSFGSKFGFDMKFILLVLSLLLSFFLCLLLFVSYLTFKLVGALLSLCGASQINSGHWIQLRRSHESAWKQRVQPLSTGSSYVDGSNLCQCGLIGRLPQRDNKENMLILSVKTSTFHANSHDIYSHTHNIIHKNINFHNANLAELCEVCMKLDKNADTCSCSS